MPAGGNDTDATDDLRAIGGRAADAPAAIVGGDRVSRAERDRRCQDGRNPEPATASVQ
jgi:hypothetical protein